MKSAFLARALVFALALPASAQIATLHIQVTDGDGAAYAAGSHSARPVAVAVTDDAGRPVAGAAVSFQLPNAGPGGLFANGLRSDLAITDANGRATIRGLQLNDTTGAFQIRITASKDQSRAGTLARQFIGGEAQSGSPAHTLKKKSGKKWVVVAVLAAGVAGGLGAGVAGRSGPPKPPAPAPPTVSLGTPTITVGAP